MDHNQGTTMATKEIRIDLLSPKTVAMLPHPPDGVHVSGVRSELLNRSLGGEIGLFFFVTAPSSIAINVFSSWLYDRIQNYRAKRFKVQGQEPKDAADLERIIREELMAL
jgi:hypothetical protein